MKTLLLVESPTKARAVAQYARGLLPGALAVRSTSGHLRDLPRDSLGVDVQAGFQPHFVLRKPRSAAYLRPLIRQADRVLLGMDPDREGEAIAWHITKLFAAELQGKTVQRVVFHEITRSGVQRGLQSPRALDRRLVKAALARRVIDRLIGYQVSPRLWAAMKSLGKDFAAGRVQIAALALLSAEEDAWEVTTEWTS